MAAAPGYRGVPTAVDETGVPLSAAGVAGGVFRASPASPFARALSRGRLPPPPGRGVGLFLNLLASGLFALAAVAAFLDVYDTVTKVSSTLLFMWVAVGRGVGVFVFSSRAADEAAAGEAFAAAMRRMLTNWHAAFALGAAGCSLLVSALAAALADADSDVAFYVSMMWGSLRLQLCVLGAASVLVVLHRRGLRASHREAQPGRHSRLFWMLPLAIVFASAAVAAATVRGANALVARDALYTTGHGVHYLQPLNDPDVQVADFLPDTDRGNWVCLSSGKDVVNFETQATIPDYRETHPTVRFSLPIRNGNTMYAPPNQWRGKDPQAQFAQLFADWTKEVDLLHTKDSMNQIGDNMCAFLRRDAVAPLAAKLGANGIIATVMPRQDLGRGAEIAHALGVCLIQRTADIYGFSLSDTVVHRGSSFLSEIIFNQTEFTAPLFAPMHGALWTYLGQSGITDPKEAWAVAHEGFCRTLIDAGVQRTAAYSGCIHGLGHGAWMSMRKIDTALAVCRAAPTRELGYNCATGVYHSLQQEGTGSPFVNSQIDMPMKMRTGEVFYPCSATNDIDDFLASCYFRYSKGYWNAIDRAGGIKAFFHIADDGFDRSGVCESVQGPHALLQGIVSSDPGQAERAQARDSAASELTDHAVEVRTLRVRLGVNGDGGGGDGSDDGDHRRHLDDKKNRKKKQRQKNSNNNNKAPDEHEHEDESKDRADDTGEDKDVDHDKNQHKNQHKHRNKDKTKARKQQREDKQAAAAAQKAARANQPAGKDHNDFGPTGSVGAAGAAGAAHAAAAGTSGGAALPATAAAVSAAQGDTPASDNRAQWLARALGRRACAWSDSTVSAHKSRPRGPAAKLSKFDEAAAFGAVCGGYRSKALLNYNRYFDWLACLVGLFQNGAVRIHEEVQDCRKLSAQQASCRAITDLSGVPASEVLLSQKYQDVALLSERAYDVCLLAAYRQGTFMPQVLDFFQE